MDRVEKIIISRSHPNWKACHRLCGKARRLGNCATYILRHRIFDKEAVPTRAELDRELRASYSADYRSMPSAASAQRIGQIVATEFKSYRKASAEYKHCPHKFLGKPRLPGYKNRYRTVYVGRNGYQITKGKLQITGGEKEGFEPLKIRCCRHQIFNAPAGIATVGDVRIVPMGNSFVVEVTYSFKASSVIKLDAKHACLIDMGLRNFATITTTRPGLQSVLLKGGVLKSINNKYNKDMAQLRSLDKKGHFGLKAFKRKRQIDDILHKIRANAKTISTLQKRIRRFF